MVLVIANAPATTVSAKIPAGAPVFGTAATVRDPVESVVAPFLWCVSVRLC